MTDNSGRTTDAPPQPAVSCSVTPSSPVKDQKDRITGLTLLLPLIVADATLVASGGRQWRSCAAKARTVRTSRLRLPRQPSLAGGSSGTRPLSQELRSYCAASPLCAKRKVQSGGGERNRTDDLLLAKQALSQLSYTPSSQGGRAAPENWGRAPALALASAIARTVPASREPQQPSLAGDLSCSKALSAQQALRLSLSPFCAAGAKWWAREDLNLRPHAYQARALTN